MSIQGNTVGNSAPRADFAQTDPTKPDYIKNKPDTAAIKETADKAKETADQALPAAGGTVEGDLTLQGQLILTRGVHYGVEAERPADAVEGQVFLRILE